MLAALLAFQPAAVPADVPALLGAMAAEARKLKNYRDEWLLVIESGGQKVQLKVLRSIDGDRGGLMALAQDVPVLWLGSDGKKSFYISPQTESFAELTTGNAWSKVPTNFEPGGIKDGDFNFNFDGVYDLAISSKPSLKLVGIENSIVDGEKARKATMEAKRPGSKGGVSLQLWLMADRWIPIRAEAEVTNAQGDASKFRAFRVRSDDKATLSEQDFSFPTSAVEGFARVPWGKLVPGFSG
jgi:hypothetical protein